MAETPIKTVDFLAGCPDCGERRVQLPPQLPPIADDFDWIARDYDSFRLMMMEELAYRFPERRRWTPADMEAVIVELVAAALDRLSHAADVIHAERYLETARRPQSVRRLLKLIGYDAATDTVDEDWLAVAPPENASDAERAKRLETYWRDHPAAMERARAIGPARIREQRRMVSLADYVQMFEKHPLVERARARVVSNGAWTTILVSVLPAAGLGIDDRLKLETDPAGTANVPADLVKPLQDFHRRMGLARIVSGKTSVRSAFQGLADAYRMAGTEVLVEGAKIVPITFTLSVRARPQYFQSELRLALIEVLADEHDGLFALGRLGFGDPIYVSDIIEAAVQVEGVETACVSNLRRYDGRYPDRTGAGFIPIAEDEIAVCLNRRGDTGTGRFRVVVTGGAVG